MDELALLLFAAAFFLVGIASGIVSGLFGVGGGVLRIPVFVLVFPAFGIHSDVEIRVAAATSLALAVPACLIAVRKHLVLGHFERGFLCPWISGIAAGAIGGLLLAPFVPADGLKIAFALCMAGLAVYFWIWGDGAVIASHPPEGGAKAALSVGIGGYCVMIGVAGGSLTTPLLKACSMPMARALAAGSATSLVVSVLGAGGGVWTGLGIADRPSWSLGYVDGLVFLLMLPGVLFATGPGVALGSRLKPELLRKCYAAFLTLIAVSMVVHLMGSRSGIT
jgi:uncharacterized membrane protein YfcA